MTDEEYLRACGWYDANSGTTRRDEDKWRHRRREHEPSRRTAEAVDVQVAEDRARFAFVQSRGGASGFAQTGCWVSTTGGVGGATGGNGAATAVVGNMLVGGGGGGSAYQPAPPPKPADGWTPISLVFDTIPDDSGVPYESLSADPERPDARLVPSSGRVRTAPGRTIRFNPEGWRSMRLDADGSTWWFAKGPALVPIVMRCEPAPSVERRGQVFLGMKK